MIPKKRKELTPEEAFTRLAAYCAYAEHSPHEVRTKCKTYGISGELCDELIERLESEGYLNEERFAHAFVRVTNIASTAGGLFAFRLSYAGTVSLRTSLTLLLRNSMRKKYRGKALSWLFLSASIAPSPRDCHHVKFTND